MSFNLTNEMSKLLFFTGEVSSAIRLYSSYARDDYREFSRQDSYDLMYLSDILHYFTELSSQITKADETKNYQNLIAACRHVIYQYENYQDEKIQSSFAWNAITTFKNPQNIYLVDLDLAIGSLKSIIEKCEKI